MPEKAKAYADGPRQRGRRALFGICIVVAAVGVILCLAILTMMDGQATADVQLPQSLEEYRAALDEPDFGMYFLDFSDNLSPSKELTFRNAKLHLYELIGRRHRHSGSTSNIHSMVADYSAIVGKRVSFGDSWRVVTNAVYYDDSVPKTRRETLRIIEGVLRTNGGFVFPLNSTNLVLLTERDLEKLGVEIPDQR